MSQPFIGELRMFGFPFPPRGWALANGQTTTIAQNQALFALVGTTYGGDGTSTFMLPNLQGSTALHRSNGFNRGQVGGEANVTLTTAQIPAHTHPFAVSSTSATSTDPAGNAPAQTTATIYGPPGAVNFDPVATTPAGNSQAHNNMPPYLVINWCIALTGVFSKPELKEKTMSQSYIGEIRMGGWNFAPQGWAFCDGTPLQISQNETLFALIGTTYGGDGQTTFNLPDLRGRIPVHQGKSFLMGAPGGSETVTLTPAQLPTHNHAIVCSTAAGTSGNPSGLAPALAPAAAYNPAGNPTPMANVLGNYGAGQPHENLMPYLCITFIIALVGIYPSQG